MHRIPVRQIMTETVVSVHPEELVADAAQLMEELDLRRLPVVDDDHCVIGIITDSDVLQVEAADLALNSYAPDADEAWLTVAEIMTRDVVTIDINATVGQLATTLSEHKVGGVPVVVMDPRFPRRRLLAGIVTETDIFRMIAQAWSDYVAAGGASPTLPTASLQPEASSESSSR
ncbi:MAG: CBS domain-containing protein [Caldilineaceae bacterium]